MNPLKAIKQWYDAGVDEMRAELIFLTYRFHPEPAVNSMDAKMRIKVFEQYMDSGSLGRAVVIQRALFLKGLINFGLSGRDTEEGWERARQKNESMAMKLNGKISGTTDMYAEFMKDYSIRKAQWIAWGNVWYALKQDVLSDDQIGYWYYVAEAIKTDPQAIK